MPVRSALLATSLLALGLLPPTFGQSPESSDAPVGDAAAEQPAPLAAGPLDPQEKIKPGAIDEDAQRDFRATKSGLRYRILRQSDKVKPRRVDAVEVHYKGWLDNGEIFDSSYRKGKRAKFLLPQVIKGWIEGLQLLGVDGMIELEIPAKLAYGERGNPPVIPENAQLHFVIELFNVTKLEP